MKPRWFAPAGLFCPRVLDRVRSEFGLAQRIGEFFVSSGRHGSGLYEQRTNVRIDEQIVTMYSRGMSTRDIQTFVRNLYGVNISPDYVSTVTDCMLDGTREVLGM